MKIIRVMCTGRVDPGHVLRAFSKGTDGVLIAGCHLGECNYITHGNYHALNMVLLLRKILEHIGLNPERLRIAFMSGAEGNLYAEVVNNFVNKVKELGPLGKGEGIEDESELTLKLKAITRLVPYLRLVENERLRAHFETLEEYQEFYSSKEFEKIFEELIADKLAISQIILLLQERPLSTAEISEIIGLTPSEISRHLNNSSKQGLVKYEVNQKRFVLA
jgi:F420-non-reducing hydrogenase iron-sulfur subunit